MGSTGQEPVCGDGSVDAGEQCDDANQNDADACTNACALASCGDGIVGPGEACDDGNPDDADACTNACALASCGDGKLQVGEECDDGNQDDADSCTNVCKAAICGDGIVGPGEPCDDGNADNTDACVGTCVVATCGDGFLHKDVESCDDGNASDADTCTSLCEAPSCMDGLKSGLETDIDCGGGSCPKCGLDDACVAPSDCGSGTCDAGICVYPSSCKALKQAQPGAVDGVHDLDPDGQGPAPAFKGYCDMSTDGGGWTLAMRFAPSNGQFHFHSPHWITKSLVGANVADPSDPSDGKFPAYNELPGGEIRGCLQHPQTKAYGCKLYPLPKTTTLLDLFTNTPVGSDIAMKGLYFVETQAEQLKWLTIQGRTLADITGPVNYVAVGINIDDDQTCFDARVRFGLGLNNEVNSVSLNDTAGFGAQASYTLACDLAPGVDSGWRVASGLQSGSKSYSTAGHIWIR